MQTVHVRIHSRISVQYCRQTDKHISVQVEHLLMFSANFVCTVYLGFRVPPTSRAYFRFRARCMLVRTGQCWLCMRDVANVLHPCIWGTKDGTQFALPAWWSSHDSSITNLSPARAPGR